MRGVKFTDPQTERTIIQNLRFYRLKAGLQQGELARAAGLSQAMISGYERRRYEPRGKNREKLVFAVVALYPQGLPQPEAYAEPEEGLPGPARFPCPHCKTWNYAHVDHNVPGLEFTCVSCSRHFTLSQIAKS